MAEYDYGQAQIAAFGQQVDAGLVKYEKGTAEELVRLYQNVIDELIRKQTTAQQLTTFDGLGDFPSLEELAAGFAWKGGELWRVYSLFIGGAKEMQRHFLKASGDLAAAEQRHSESLRSIATALEANK